MRRKLRRKKIFIPLALFGVLFLAFNLSNYLQRRRTIEKEFGGLSVSKAAAHTVERVRLSDVIELNRFIGSVAGAAAAPTASTIDFNRRYAYNKRLSDKIGAYRALPDTRDEACEGRNYYLPQNQRLKVSVIIAFHNEARSTLMRTIMAVYRRTPAKYLHELILLDDNSDDGEPKSLLLSTLRHLAAAPFARTFNKDTSADDADVADTFISSSATATEPDGKNQHRQSHHHNGDVHELVVIKMQRNSRRLGLIESRNRGARLATGDYLFFLDSHCEVNVGWLEPLLERAADSNSPSKSPVIAVSPVLDSIDAKTLQYRASSPQLMGGFDWNLHFHWIPRELDIQKQLNEEASPFRSPVTAGGVFLISRKGFFDLNGFNSYLKIWGGESIEFSIKLWLCGGGHIEIVPCSRVGHIFRKKHDFKFPKDDDGQATYLRNSKIIAETWLDSYKNFYYALKPAARFLRLNISKTELESVKHARKCKSFEWYLRYVFPELKLPNDDFIAFGKLSTADERCLHIFREESEDVEPEPLSKRPHQVLLKPKSAISSSTRPLSPMNRPHVRLKMANCYHTDVTEWYLHRHNGHLHSSNGACLNVIRISMPPSTTITTATSSSSSSASSSLSLLSSSSSAFLNQTLHLDAVTAATHFIVVLQYCHRQTSKATTTSTTPPPTPPTKAQRWLRRGAQLIHEQTHLCLDNPLNDVVAVSHCRHEAPSQLFHFTMEMQQLWQL